MFERDRGGLFKAVTGIFIATLVVLAFIAVWTIASGTTRDDENRRRNTEQYSQAVNQRIAADCLNIEVIAMTQCIREIIQSTNEDTRSESDLQAQRGMERWAFWMLVIASVGTFGSFVGVYLVWSTFNATRDANNTSRKTAEQQLRGYLHAESAYTIFDRIGARRYNYAVYITLKNGGLSPVTLIEQSISDEMINHGGSGGGRANGGDKTIVKIGPGSTYTKAYGELASQGGMTDFGDVADEHWFFVVMAGIRYTYVDNLEETITEEVWFRSERSRATSGVHRLNMNVTSRYNNDLIELHSC